MQQIDDDLGFCPSFNCYSSDSLASTAAIKVSSQLLHDDQQVARIHDIGGEEDFEFSSVLRDDEERLSAGDTASEVPVVFPLFNRDLVTKNEGDQEAVEPESKVDDCSDSLGKLFIDERQPEEESASSSSSEADESEDEAPGVFCAWRPKMDIGGSSPLSKCKKSSSTGSGSKRWRIRDLLRRSNSEGKEPMVLTLTPPPKKVENNIPKQKRNNNGEVTSIVSGKVSGKSKPSIHELLYVQQRAKREGGKRKSYLPYRQGLVGFFSNVNGKGNKFPF